MATQRRINANRVGPAHLRRPKSEFHQTKPSLPAENPAPARSAAPVQNKPKLEQTLCHQPFTPGTRALRTEKHQDCRYAPRSSLAQPVLNWSRPATPWLPNARPTPAAREADFAKQSQIPRRESAPQVPPYLEYKANPNSPNPLCPHPLTRPPAFPSTLSTPGASTSM
jgi:hypothetical protein